MSESEKNPYYLEFEDLKKYIPHRFPFLLIDRVLEIHPKGDLSVLDAKNMPGVRAKAVKAVSGNEHFFEGHFPTKPVMPGVLILEALAQTTTLSLYPYLCRDMDRLARDFQCFLVGAEKVRFRRPVVPGDLLVLETEVLKVRGPLWVFKGMATVDGKKVAEAEIMANLLVKGEGI